MMGCDKCDPRTTKNNRVMLICVIMHIYKSYQLHQSINMWVNQFMQFPVSTSKTLPPSFMFFLINVI